MGNLISNGSPAGLGQIKGLNVYSFHGRLVWHGIKDAVAIILPNEHLVHSRLYPARRSEIFTGVALKDSFKLLDSISCFFINVERLYNYKNFVHLQNDEMSELGHTLKLACTTCMSL